MGQVNTPTTRTRDAPTSPCSDPSTEAGPPVQPVTDPGSLPCTSRRGEKVEWDLPLGPTPRWSDVLVSEDVETGGHPKDVKGPSPSNLLFDGGKGVERLVRPSVCLSSCARGLLLPVAFEICSLSRRLRAGRRGRLLFGRLRGAWRTTRLRPLSQQVLCALTRNFRPVSAAHTVHGCTVGAGPEE